MKKHYTRLCDSQISSVVFASLNSDFIVFGCENGDISLFSSKSNRILWTNKDPADYLVRSVAVSPTDDMVASGGFKRFLRVIDAANGNTICSVNLGYWIWRILFISPQKIACGLWNGAVAIVCWQTKKIEKILKIGEKAVFGLAISPVDIDVLLTGDSDGVIKQTILSSGKTVMVYEGHTDAVYDLKFLSGGNMFVSGSNDQTARLFALDQKQAIRVFKGHTLSVRYVSLIHEDELLITTSFIDLKVWKMESGECLSTLKVDQRICCSSVSKDEKSLVVGRFFEQLEIFHVPPRPAVSLDRKLRLQR